MENKEYTKEEINYKQILNEELLTLLNIKYKYPSELTTITDEQRLERIKGYMECIEDMNSFLKHFNITYGNK